MDWLNELGRRIEILLHRRRFRADLEKELHLHIDLRMDQRVGAVKVCLFGLEEQ